MTRDEATKLFDRAFSEVCPPTELDIVDELPLANLGVSSLDIVEMTMVMEEKGELQFPEDAFAEVRTVGDVVDVVVSVSEGE